MALDAFDLIDEWGPEKIICVSDRASGMKGVLVIDNTARGIGKGGTRMSPTLTVTEVARLARAMTWKWAAVDLFHGGAKAGILGDPRGPGKEAILRAFARALANEVPAEYAFGLDVGLNEADAAIFVDELRDRGASTGLPSALGGLPYDQLGVTGFGVAEATEAAAEQLGLAVRGARVAVQGFGAVGAATAKRLVELGAVVVATATSAGSIADPNGLDVARLLELRDTHGDDCVVAYDAPLLPPEKVLDTDCDILVPAALQDVIDKHQAETTSAKLIVEGANLPTTPAGRDILHERGVTLVPDFIANAGGIVAAAHSTDARNSPFRVDPTSVFEMISRKMRENAAAVITESLRSNVIPHEAARRLAQARVGEAMRLRGRVPTAR